MLERNAIPADRVAARVIAPAAEICKPPIPPPKFMSNNQPDLKRRLVRDAHGKLVEEVTDKSSMAIDAHVVDNHTKNGANYAHEMTNKVNDAVEAMNKLRSDFTAEFKMFQDESKKAIHDIREIRIALGGETKQIMGELGDVRKFFLDDRHEHEMKTLREMVELCERLEYLHQKGFLDAVADVILKLAKK